MNKRGETDRKTEREKERKNMNLNRKIKTTITQCNKENRDHGLYLKRKGKERNK